MPHLNLLMEAAIFCLICDWMAFYSRLPFLLQSCEPSDSNFWRLPFCFDLTLEFHWYNHSKVLALFSFHALWASVNCLTVTVVFVCGVFFFPIMYTSVSLNWQIKSWTTQNDLNYFLWVLLFYQNLWTTSSFSVVSLGEADTV